MITLNAFFNAVAEVENSGEITQIDGDLLDQIVGGSGPEDFHDSFKDGTSFQQHFQDGYPYNNPGPGPGLPDAPQWPSSPR